MDSAAFFALAASFSWVLSQLFGHKPALYYGSLQFNRLRMIVASLLLALMIMLNGNSWELASGDAHDNGEALSFDDMPVKMNSWKNLFIV